MGEELGDEHGPLLRGPLRHSDRPHGGQVHDLEVAQDRVLAIRDVERLLLEREQRSVDRQEPNEVA